MEERLLRQVWERAESRCEYCLVHQDHDELTHEVDHVIAIKHGGPTRLSNLALSCFSCNNGKGPNIAGIDPESKVITPLFHPRRNRWGKHFRWDGAVLVGVTAIGRVTVAVLNINLPHRVELREALIEEGVFPPTSTG
jgi:hypothetical protein